MEIDVNKLLTYARSYVSNSISVIPTEYKGKQPTIKTWLPYRETIPSIELIDSWFNKPSNIAVVTGDISNLAIIDIDSMFAYGKIIKQAPWITSNPIVKSGKGYHIWISLWEYPNTTQFEIDGTLCHIKSNGGLCTAPPSIHATGKEYKFISGESVRPVDIIDYEELKRIIESAGGIFKHTEVLDRSVTWASELCENTSEGGRNDAAIRLAGLLIRKFFYDKGLVMGLMEGWNLKFCNPPLEQDELERLVRLAVARYNPERSN